MDAVHILNIPTRGSFFCSHVIHRPASFLWYDKQQHKKRSGASLSRSVLTCAKCSRSPWWMQLLWERVWRWGQAKVGNQGHHWHSRFLDQTQRLHFHYFHTKTSLHCLSPVFTLLVIKYSCFLQLFTLCTKDEPRLVQVLTYAHSGWKKYVHVCDKYWAFQGVSESLSWLHGGMHNQEKLFGGYFW